MLDAAPSDPPPLSREADATLTEQLAARFRERIRQRLIAPGARLPSVRECARRHGVSPHTVVAAYDQLLALGLVEARRQRGFYVRETASARAAPARCARSRRAISSARCRFVTANRRANRACAMRWPRS
jgi:DNA-binding transcriptional regulator YhcF (GntR family)